MEHPQHKDLNNRAENSHQPTRLREKKMRRFKSPSQAQRFLAAAELIYQQTQPKRHRLTACVTRQVMVERMQSWKEMIGVRCLLLYPTELLHSTSLLHSKLEFGLGLNGDR